MSFKVEKCTVFNEFKLEKCTPDFWVFMDNLKKSPSALWECGSRETGSKALWEVWVPLCGIHAFHNDGISTKLVLRDIV